MDFCHLMIFNQIIINLPQSDLEKIKEEEEKVREELSKESENNENKILEGNEEIKINDPVEKIDEIKMKK